jgi:hypothetical protein
MSIGAGYGMVRNPGGCACCGIILLILLILAAIVLFAVAKVFWPWTLIFVLAIGIGIWWRRYRARNANGASPRAEDAPLSAGGRD